MAGPIRSHQEQGRQGQSEVIRSWFVAGMMARELSTHWVANSFMLEKFRVYAACIALFRQLLVLHRDEKVGRNMNIN